MEKDFNLKIFDVKTYEAILELVQEEIEDSDSEDVEYEKVFFLAKYDKKNHIWPLSFYHI